MSYKITEVCDECGNHEVAAIVVGWQEIAVRQKYDWQGALGYEVCSRACAEQLRTKEKAQRIRNVLERGIRHG